MSLSEKLRQKKCRTLTVTVDGDEYTVTGKSKRERGQIFARARRKNGTVNGERLETLMLVECVVLAEDGSKASDDDWEAAPSHITGPLVKAISEVCGLDGEDLGKEPEGSDETGS